MAFIRIGAPTQLNLIKKIRKTANLSQSIAKEAADAGQKAAETEKKEGNTDECLPDTDQSK